MFRLYPLVRLAAAFAISVAAFLVSGPLQALVLYALVAVGLIAANVARRHLRFLVASAPLLVALLFIWGFIAPPAGASANGVEVAILFWLRICILGGAFQWLLLPLTDSPLHLKGFLAKLRLPAWATLLLVTPIVFLPEIGRRIERVVEARKAQGLPSTGLGAVRALPEIITPLMASLLEGALSRAELWSHRDLLAADPRKPAPLAYSLPLGASVVLAVPLTIGLALWI